MSTAASICAAKPLRLAGIAMASGLALAGMPDDADAKTLRFAGYDFDVREAGKGGPGPNYWDPDNAFLDSQGRLHVKLSKRGNKWFAAEVKTKKRLGFGRYEFTVVGPIDKLDKNIVLGLFNYPSEDVGPDETNEIDIEFARWGKVGNPNGNFTVWPAELGESPRTKSFEFSLDGDRSRHSFAWRSKSVVFRSSAELRSGKSRPIKSWSFKPPRPEAQIGQTPEPVYINLWAFRGTPPSDGRDVELIVEDFTFTPFQ